MKASITHFVVGASGVAGANDPIVVPLGTAANTHFAMRKVSERLTEAQIPQGTYMTIITIEHTNNGGGKEGIK